MGRGHKIANFALLDNDFLNAVVLYLSTSVLSMRYSTKQITLPQITFNFPFHLLANTA